MSTNVAAVLSVPQHAPTRAPSSRPISAVDTRPVARKTSALSYVGVSLLGIILIVAGQLALGAALGHGAYELSSAKNEKQQLAWTLQNARQDVQQLSAPQNIAANAEAQGMVINGSPAYLRLSDGAVLGVPGAAVDNAPVPMGGSGLVPNALIAGSPLAGGDGRVPGTAPGAPAEGTPPAAVSLDEGLPVPSTH